MWESFYRAEFYLSTEMNGAKCNNHFHYENCTKAARCPRMPRGAADILTGQRPNAAHSDASDPRRRFQQAAAGALTKLG